MQTNSTVHVSENSSPINVSAATWFKSRGCFPYFGYWNLGTEQVWTLRHSFSGAGVRFSLNGITYQNNSLVILEEIGENGDALTCVTDQPFCCRPPYTSVVGQTALGNWLFPNGTRVLSSGMHWDFHRTRGQMLLRLHRRKGGENGIYHCVIPDATNVTQTIYIGVYTAGTGE